MAFDEYQFLRYFIPGSLYVIYSTALLIPFLSPTATNYFRANPQALLGLVGDAFGTSLAFGYIIYTFYDTYGYNKIAMRPENRPIIDYLQNHEADFPNWKDLNDYEKKELLDMFYDGFGKGDSNDKVSDRISVKTRGIWSHFNARQVCYFYVPFFAGGYCSINRHSG